MHVEPVAWISSRKDVLYAFFFFLSLLSYLKYHLRQDLKKRHHYFLSLFFFICALLSKINAAPLPLILILFDYLYLNRSGFKIWLEKIPFLGLSLVFGIFAIYAQQEVDAISSINTYPFHLTPIIPLFNFGIYIVKAIIPFHLSAFHPYFFEHVSEIPFVVYFGAAAVLAGLVLVWKVRNKNIILFGGMVFFALMILPNLQFLPCGKAMHAERYSYISYLGLFYILSSGIHYLIYSYFKNRLIYQRIFLSFIVVYILLLSLVSYQRIQVWKNGETLWVDVINKYPDHYLAYKHLCNYYYRVDDLKKAMAVINQAIEKDSRIAENFYLRALIFDDLEDYHSALNDYNEAIFLDPNYHKSYVNKSRLLIENFRDTVAGLDNLNTAIDVNPKYELAFINKGVICEKTGDDFSALQAYNQGLAQIPKSSVLLRYKAMFLYKNGNSLEAINYLNLAIQYNPQYGEAYHFRSIVHKGLGNNTLADRDANKAKLLGYIVE